MSNDIKIMFNEDVCHHISETWEATKYRGEEFLNDIEKVEREFVYQYKDTQLTDFLINVNFDNSVFPSKVRTWYGDKVGKRMEKGKIVDYGEKNVFRDIFFTDKFDLFEFWVKTFREIGVRPWLSFRMNDCHDKSSERSIMHSDFAYDHPEYIRVTHHIADGYFAKCLNFEEKEVRDWVFDYIEEAVDRYDVDGIELDFMREMLCFTRGGEYDGMKMMTEFIRRIRNMLNSYGEKRGHKIMLSVRLYAVPHHVYFSGYDYFTWAKEGLIDVFVAGPRWETVDNDVPTEVWKNIFEPYGVKFGVAQELILRCHPRGRFYHLNTHETDLGSAAANLSAGADFTYLFNHMRPNCIDYSRQLVWDIYQEDNYQMIMRNAGTLETALDAPRRHVATFHDVEPEWEKGKLSCLPLEAHHDNVFHIVRVRCGIVKEGSEVWLILGAKGVGRKKNVDLDAFEVYINSHKLECTRTCDLKPHTLWKGYCFKIEDISILSQANVIEVTSAGQPFKVEMAEIRVNAELK